jgi:hypothetical protein
METIILLRKIDKFDLRKMKRANRFFIASISMFSSAGISFSLSEKFLEASQKLITENDIDSMFALKTFETVHNYLAGHWNREYKIDDKLLNAVLRSGDLWMVYVFITYSFSIAISRGEFEYWKILLNKMSEIFDNYDYEFGRFRESLCQVSYHLNKCQIYDISRFVDTSMTLLNKLGLKDYTLRILGMSAKAQILLKDITGAEGTLSQAKQIIPEAGRVIPLHSRDYFISQFLFDVYQYENLLTAIQSGIDKSKMKEFKRKAHKSGKDAIKLSKKVAEKKPEALRLMGILNWLANKQKKALKWWDKSIRTGEQLGARPELVRTFMEVGKRLLEPKSKHRELNGISAEGYLDKAQALFEEMELEWDLEQLENVRQEVATANSQ